MVSTIKDIDERAFIAQLASVFGRGKDELKIPAGDDDWAVLEFGGEYLGVTTDMLHQKTDFPDTMTPWQIGWMAAAVNFSDIAAMGGQPLGLLAALGYPQNMSLEDAGEIARGMRDCAEFCETSVIGGDVDSHEELTITGTALGRVSREELLTRKGARPGDLICVTATLGGAGAALEAYLKNMDVDNDFMKPLLEPVPRIAEGRMLAKSGAVTSAMDTSDGLALSLYDLASVNEVGFVLREESLPNSRTAQSSSPAGIFNSSFPLPKTEASCAINARSSISFIVDTIETSGNIQCLISHHISNTNVLVYKIRRHRKMPESMPADQVPAGQAMIQQVCFS